MTDVPLAGQVSPWRVLRLVPSPLRDGERVLVVSAHPDDETIGAGRLLAQHDGPVAAVTLTAGERCVPELDPDEMRQRRLAEWRTAMDALGARPLGSYPRWPDGELADHEADLAEGLTGLAAGFDVLVATWRHDPHPDHAAAGRAVARAARTTGARLVEFPVWAPFWTAESAVDALGYDAAQVASSADADRARDRALAAYRSQTGTLVPGTAPVVPAAMLDRHPVQLVMEPR